MWGTVEREAFHPNAAGQILKKQVQLGGLTVGSLESFSPQGFRAGFVTEAYKARAQDEQIMAHTRHKDVRTMHGYVRRAKLLTENPAKTARAVTSGT